MIGEWGATKTEAWDIISCSDKMLETLTHLDFPTIVFKKGNPVWENSKGGEKRSDLKVICILKISQFEGAYAPFYIVSALTILKC